jgi:hypothetical protein
LGTWKSQTKSARELIISHHIINYLNSEWFKQKIIISLFLNFCGPGIPWLHGEIDACNPSTWGATAGGW